MQGQSFILIIQDYNQLLFTPPMVWMSSRYMKFINKWCLTMIYIYMYACMSVRARMHVYSSLLETSDQYTVLFHHNLEW